MHRVHSILHWSHLWIPLVTALSILIAYLLEIPLLAYVPVALVSSILILYDIRLLIIPAAFSLQLSQEYWLGSFGLGLPVEPLLFLLLPISLLVIVKKEPWDPTPIAHSPIALILFLHLTWILTTALLSEMPVISLKFFLAKLWYIIPAIVVMAVPVVQDPKTRRMILYAMIGGMTFVVIWFLFRYAELGFALRKVNQALKPWSRNHVDFAVGLCLLLPYLLLMLKHEKQRRLKKLLAIAFVLWLIALFVSWTRAAWLAIAASMVAIPIIRLRLFISAMIIGLISLGLSIHLLTYKNFYMVFAPDPRYVRAHDDLASHLEATVAFRDVSVAERIYRWLAGIEMWKEHPVAGFGPNTFYHFYDHYTVEAFRTWVSLNPERSDVHNYYLQVLIEQGIPGLAIWLLLMFSSLIIAYRLMFKLQGFLKDLTIASFFSLLMAYVHIFFSNQIEAISNGPIFWFSIGIVAYIHSVYLKNKGTLT